MIIFFNIYENINNNEIKLINNIIKSNKKEGKLSETGQIVISKIYLVIQSLSDILEETNLNNFIFNNERISDILLNGIVLVKTNKGIGLKFDKYALRVFNMLRAGGLEGIIKGSRVILSNYKIFEKFLKNLDNIINRG